jgi:hypothetical protein
MHRQGRYGLWPEAGGGLWSGLRELFSQELTLPVRCGTARGSPDVHADQCAAPLLVSATSKSFLFLFSKKKALSFLKKETKNFCFL